MRFKEHSPTVKLLELLKDSIDPLDIKALFHYLLKLGYNKRQVHNSLRRLEYHKFIVSNGRKKSKLYRINEPGLKVLYEYNVKNDARNIKLSIDKVQDYLFMNPGVD